MARRGGRAASKRRSARQQGVAPKSAAFRGGGFQGGGSQGDFRGAPVGFQGGGFQGGGFQGGSFQGDLGGALLTRALQRSTDWRGGDWRGSGFRVAQNRDQCIASWKRGLAAVRLGWHADLPDHRDFDPVHPKVRRELDQRKVALLAKGALPATVDNSAFCSPIEDQGELGSCTAQASVAIMEYEMRKNGVEHVDGSRLFVYKTTRSLLGWTGDTGAFLRTSIKAIAAFGIPPEEHWPYDVQRYDDEPSAFLYAYAQNFKALSYVRLDAYGAAPDRTLENVKRALAAKFAVVFGFTVFDVMGQDAAIPFPDPKTSKSLGGHAVMAVGYDDNIVIGAGTQQTKGALLVRNSWGTGWGHNGYGYLPYRYVQAGLADDFWTVYNCSWIDAAQHA